MTYKSNILDFEKDDLKRTLEDFKEPSFRAEQVWQWIYRGVETFDEMTNLPKPFREKLRQTFYIGGIKQLKSLVSEKDGTRKYLFETADGKVIESVLMKYHYGTSVCLSTQIGCRMGCSFCASAGLGLDRNLTVGEMTAQVLSMGRESGERISHIVLMGIGEPFDNYDHVVGFLKRMNSPDTLGISYRRMTVSTCGLIPEMEKFTQEDIPVNLSVSLHAPNDKIRRALMPVARRYPIDKLLASCHIYTQKTGRRVTFEYTLIQGVNDADSHAAELGRTLSGLLCHVNLIPMNAVEGTGYTKSGRERVESFRKTLERYRIPVTVRRELGTDILAACGQLRKKTMENDGMVD